MPFCGRRSKGCCRTTLTSTSNSSSNRVSPTLSRNVLTPECDSASRLPRTWSPCASGRICAWLSRGRQHKCINLRFPTAGGLYAWELQKGRRELHVRVDGQLVFNNVPIILRAAASGFGLACVLDDQTAQMVADGRLVRVLEEWCPPF